MRHIFSISAILCITALLLTGCTNDCKKANKLIFEGQHDKAIELLEQYIQKKPDDHTGYMLLGDAYIGKAKKIGGYGFNHATMEIVNKGMEYYKKSYSLERTRLVEDKMAIASGMLEQ